MYAGQYRINITIEQKQKEDAFNIDLPINIATEKGIKTLIDNFWDKENELLQQETFMRLSKLEIDKIFKNVDIEEDKYIINKNISTEFLDESYNELETFQNDILEYIDNEINILDYTITDEEEQQLNSLIETLWNKNFFS